ncbi:MAG: glutaminyl-tRNA synthase (glutamine-hydrolyzing) subunit B [Candidatus Omnitrophica bacterium CG1_02_44_16]|nr:MAG: glutaminyl-tRNA synthase (glutamine-hydrolyzing) subunit B [Candidatus Omnitrophica bacterium CG1_02_44_16]PIY82109.1 MAG: Asp-tRNA(Asn)/Glu-tRNA(Gln) amidotransferase GatCAB subunit B [Candidatus Omnitrophica bacterium CG_4_10_14_0_8_um_filter_44_12]PIZ83301.1 MAG: Asp-tRNA(Asn)/Glu-tRNA(Gln) amidotransferase GatCAB subunit B [Candidatus Omnitrophica bacterium CG_4_10_14_0_2_um_filter_44_9]
MKYEAVIGLEVHVQLKTKTKAFCGCVNEFGSKENTNICPVCLGLPGSLPVLNEKAYKMSMKVGLALDCVPRQCVKFDRKNYFYPDLPKNFQISQYDMPFAENGALDIYVNGQDKKIRIKRVHLEEDAGKLMHPEGESYSLVDFNRAGAPLLEIVSEPDMHSPDDAYQYLTDLKLIIQYLDISDCDMEKGSLRCDANISLRPEGQVKLGTKAELKNMNSFKAIKAALTYEIKRQEKILENKEPIAQETRLWDEEKEQTILMRSKEEAHDYRYFPEPDLPIFDLAGEEIQDIMDTLPELPKAKLGRFMGSYGFSQKDAAVIISSKGLADYFESCLKFFNAPKPVANWLAGPVFSEMNSRNISIVSLGLAPEHLAKLISRVEDGSISRLVAKDVLSVMLKTSQGPDAIIKDKGLQQVSGASELNKIIDEAIANNKKSVDDYLSGKENALMFLVGQVMKLSSGKANPKAVKDMMTERLKKC